MPIEEIGSLSLASVLSSAHVKLMERLTLELITHSLPYTSDPSTIAYRTVLSESMSSFCLELLSLPTLPAENDQERTHSHYYLAKHLLDDLHNSTSHRTTVILKSYLNILKHLQYSYMKQEELENLFELTHRLEEVCFNLPALVLNAMKSVKEQIHSCLQLINKFVRLHHDERETISCGLFRSMETTKTSVRILNHHCHRVLSNALRSLLNQY